jgi:histone-lysine N-methyltransferase SETMAR
VHREFVPEGKTVNAEYYLTVMKRLPQRIRRIQPEYREPVGFFFYMTPSHRSASVSSFPKLKAPMKGCRYDSISGIQTAVTSVLNSITKNDLQKSSYDLDERANHCVASEGMYFE